MNSSAEAIVTKLYTEQDFSEKALVAAQKCYALGKSGYVSKDLLTQAYQKLVGEGTLLPHPALARLLRLKATRSDSGIVVVSVLTKPYPCPGNCLYCPTQKGVPKSYLDTEPAVMRAVANAYDPYRQTITRLQSLHATGHPTDKINIRVIGGTFSFYPRRYQSWFMKRIFQACNDFIGTVPSSNNLEQAIAANETAEHRIVEVSVETRQDYITRNELRHLRSLGVTKVELGVQSIFDDVLALNRRGHPVDTTVKATALLKDAGFKVAYQMMPGLPGSDFERDMHMFTTLFGNADFQPDHLKIYPLALLKKTGVYGLFKAGSYKPYSVDELTRLLAGIKSGLPYYCRVERVIRDIPAQHIVEGGSKVSNLRQIVHAYMDKHGQTCRCIRCREVRAQAADEDVQMFRKTYEASGGTEIFLSMENAGRERLYSLLRFRIPSGKQPISQALQGATLIREIHSYGPQVRIHDIDTAASQHKGYGRALLAEAERIAKEEYGYSRIAAIAGVGVRPYFQSNGYTLQSTYMLKEL